MAQPQKRFDRKRSGSLEISAAILCSLLLTAFYFLGWTATFDKSATVDEPTNLVSGWTQVQLHDYRLNCEDPALFKTITGMFLPAGLFHFDLNGPDWQSLFDSTHARGPISGSALYQTPGVDADHLLRQERARMMFIGVVLGLTIAWWAWRLAGPIAAIFATAAFALDPNFLAHSPLVKNDVPQTALLVLFAGAICLFGERGTPLRLAMLWVLAGLTILIKFSGFLTIPILAVALTIRTVIPAPWPLGRAVAVNWKQRLAASAVVLVTTSLVAWVLVWAGYGFRFYAEPDSTAQFNLGQSLREYASCAGYAASPDPLSMRPDEISQYIAGWKPTLAPRLILFANAHRLLPQSYLVGLLRILAESQSRLGYLCGKSSVTGWWYYFPLVIAFKTPAATLVGLSVAGVWLLRRWRFISMETSWPAASLALLPIFWMLIGISSRVNVGIRHILPVYPALFIILGVVAAAAWKSSRRAIRFAPIVIALGLAAETLAAFPNYIAFFNVFAGGYRGGFHLLSESNLDWGQDLPALAEWQSRHPDRPIYLIYWGGADPRYYGIRYFNLPVSSAPPDLTAPPPGRAVYAISADVLVDPYAKRALADLFSTVTGNQPREILGGSIYLFDAR